MAPPTSPPRPPLLRLPAELRSTIYQYVFSDSRMDIYALCAGPKRSIWRLKMPPYQGCGVDALPNGPRVSGSRLQNPSYHLCNSALLLVSKEILAEAAPELYRSTTLVVHGLDTAQSLKSLVPAHFLAHIKYVHLADVDRVFSAPALGVGTPPTLLFDPDALPALETVSLCNPIFKRLSVDGNRNQRHEVGGGAFAICGLTVRRVPHRQREVSDKTILDIVHEHLSHPPARDAPFQHAVQQLRDKALRSYKVICGHMMWLSVEPEDSDWRNDRDWLGRDLVRLVSPSKIDIYLPPKSNLMLRYSGCLG